MAAKNDITGDSIQTRNVSDAYLSNYDLIFRKNKKEEKKEETEVKKEEENGNA